MAVVFVSMWLPLAPLAAAIEKPLAAGHGGERPLRIAEPHDEDLTVFAIHGRAFNVGQNGGLSRLRRGDRIPVNQPVKAGPKSGLDLRTRDGGTLELGPEAEVVLHPHGRMDDGGAMTTTVRLNQGYLKVAIEASRTGRLNVSFGRWEAHLGPGAYVFDTRTTETSVCMLTGEVRLSGAQNAAAALEPYTCMQLTERVPRPMRLTGAEWADMDTHRVLNPILTEVSHRDREKARDRREARRAAIPVVPTLPMRPADDATTALVNMPATRSAPVPVSEPLPIAPLENLTRSLEAITTPPAERLVAAYGTIETPQTVPPDPITSASRMMEAQPPGAGSNTLAMADPFAAAPDVAPQDALIGPDGTASETSPLEWIVNVATHSSLESAEFQAAQLRSRNLPASIRRETVRGRTAYRVVVDGLATEQAANGVVRTLVSDLGVRQAWVFRKH